MPAHRDALAYPCVLRPWFAVACSGSGAGSDWPARRVRVARDRRGVPAAGPLAAEIACISFRRRSVIGADIVASPVYR